MTMNKFLIKLWTRGENFEESMMLKASYVTIKITTLSREETGVENQIVFNNDGVCTIPCDDYEIIGSGTSDDWVKYFRFHFNGLNCLNVSTVPTRKKTNSFSMSFPIPIKD